jgi:hypothetical protein
MRTFEVPPVVEYKNMWMDLEDNFMREIQEYATDLVIKRFHHIGFIKNGNILFLPHHPDLNYDKLFISIVDDISPLVNQYFKIKIHPLLEYRVYSSYSI